jgi:hypothetical protein
VGELNRDAIDKDVIVKDDATMIKKQQKRTRNGRDNRTKNESS